MQPTIIRLYKVAGLIALTAILVGLIGFLVVNIFYFFDHTWVKPMKLDPSHEKVVAASKQVIAAKADLEAFDREKTDLSQRLKHLDEKILGDKEWLASATPFASQKLQRPDELVWRDHVLARQLDLSDATGRRVVLQQQLDSLGARRASQEQLVHQLEASPYLRAGNNTAYVAFVPYRNLGNITVGKTKLYACSWGLVNCHTVGKVTALIEGEVTESHPHDDSVQRGQMVEVQLTTPDASKENVLFAGGKPLWLF